ncbi:MAG: hypothetical protein SF029_00515 [bacterium]|nr:hypothetical protein [bacterium]
MAITVDWSEDDSLLVFQCVEELTAEDIEAIGRIGTEYANRTPIRTLIDLSDAAAFPRNLVNTALRSALFMTFVNHPNVEWFVFVRPGTNMRFMIEIVLRSARVKMVESRESALAFLRAQPFQSGDHPQP